MKSALYFRAHRALTLACLAACVSVQAHAGTDLATGSSSLTNLSFSLVDLAPQSGQGTWIQFGQPNLDVGVSSEPGLASLSGLLARDADGVPVGTAGQSAYFDGPVPQQAYSLVAADGSGTLNIGPSGIAVTMRVGDDAMNQAIVVPGAISKTIDVFNRASFGSSLSMPYVDVNHDTGVYNVITPYGSNQPVNFTLSAHTQLVFEADASALVAVGPNLTYGQLDQAGNPWVSADVSIFLARTTLLRPFAETYASWGELSADMLALYDWQEDGLSAWLQDDPSLMTPASRRLRVTLTNDSDEAMEGMLGFNVDSYASLAQSVPAPVPEPGTYMLMGLGLFGIFWRRRCLSQ